MSIKVGSIRVLSGLGTKLTLSNRKAPRISEKCRIQIRKIAGKTFRSFPPSPTFRAH
jgi:hypothetical protein